MKKNLKRIYFLILILISCHVVAQEGVSKKIGVLKTREGKLNEMYDYVTKDYDSWSFHDEKGKFKVIKSDKIEWAKIGSRKFIRHAIRDNKKDERVLELIVQSDKYKLFFSEGHNNFVYIFDMSDKLMEDPIKLFDAHGAGIRSNNEKVIKIVSKYFSGCGDFINKVNENLNSKNNLFDNLGYWPCEGSADLEPLFK